MTKFVRNFKNEFSTAEIPLLPLALPALSGGYDITILNYLPTTAFVSPRNMMKPKVIIKVVNFQVDRQFSRQFHLKIPSVI